MSKLTVKNKQNEILTVEAVSWLVRHGIKPDDKNISSYIQKITNKDAPNLTAPPPIENGLTAESKQWETALRNLNTDIESLRQHLAGLQRKSLEGDWQYISRQLSYLEVLNNIIKAGKNTTAGSFVEKFTHIPYLFDALTDVLPEQDCEIDFSRMCVSLPQQDGWCSRQDISDSDVLWYVEPAKCPTEQSGNIKDLTSNNGNPWAISVGETSRAVLTIIVKLQQPVTGNSAFIDIISRYDNISLKVNGGSAVAANKEKTWWIFPAQPVDSIELTITKDNYDTDTGKKHYFCIRRFLLQYNKYTTTGVFVSHAIRTDGCEVRVTPDISIPEGTGATYSVGFQDGRLIQWQNIKGGEWIKVPWFGDKTTDYVTYNPTDPPVQIEPDIYLLHQLNGRPVVSSIEVYPGLNMLAVEAVVPSSNEEPTLENWFKLKQGASLYRYMPLTSGLTVSNGLLYRLYTYAKVDLPGGIIIENWRPAPGDVLCNVYVNQVEQVREGGKYNLKLQTGWNLIELIAKSDRELFFDPMLYLEDKASIICLSKGYIHLISLKDLRRMERNTAIDVIAYHDGMLLVNYPAKSTGTMRYMCRYYTSRESDTLVRFMVNMYTNKTDFSPVLTGYTVEWR